MPLRRPTWLLVLVVLCGILAGLPAGPARGAAAGAAAPGPAPDPAFGIDGAMRWPAWGTFAQPAAVARQAGAAWVREDFAWGLIEPHPGQFSWEATDRLVDALQAQGLHILGILSYSAAWAVPGAGAGASGISFQAPDLGQYRAFVQTLVARYRGRVAAWEVWNEPNSALFWQPAPDPAAYAALLQTAYGAVKAADPAAQVLTGGMSGNAVPFLEAMLAAGAANSFDILALHPYAVPVDPAQGRAQSSPDTHKLATVELPKYRAFLARHGLSRPIWVTEIGWPAADWQLDPDTQAAYLAQAYALLLGGGIAQKVFWYSFKDEGAAAGQSWGLLGWGGGAQDLGAARPAFAAYQAAARILSGAQPLPAAPPAGAQTLDAFEAPAAWHRTYGPVGSLEISGDTSHGGAHAGKLAYQFSGPNQAVDVAPPAPIAVPGRPARLGLWVRGDSSGNYLSVWLRDATGALFKLRLGAMDAGGAGWQYLDAPLDGYFFPWEVAGGGGAAPQFPVSVVALRLENTPDEPAGSGVVYVDDLTASPGPAVDDVRFARPGGDVVDVVWADHAGGRRRGAGHDDPRPATATPAGRPACHASRSGPTRST